MNSDWFASLGNMVSPSMPSNLYISSLHEKKDHFYLNITLQTGDKKAQVKAMIDSGASSIFAD